ncbi:MAG: hypothetical protein ACYTG5_22950 [Planctomycetota bacterium]|jgi:hypothetical protein
MPSQEVLLLLQAAASTYMLGLIWFVQVVHYPLMARVGEAGFGSYAEQHQKLTSLVVMPVMLLELAVATALLLDAPEGMQARLRIGAALLLVIWLSTFLVQVPCHRRMLRGFDSAAIRRLVSSNWIRTVAWTLRAALSIDLLLRYPWNGS